MDFAPEADLERLNAEERTSEIVAIFAAGLRRSLAGQSSLLFANIHDNSLDFIRPKSGRVLRRVRYR